MTGLLLICLEASVDDASCLGIREPVESNHLINDIIIVFCCYFASRLIAPVEEKLYHETRTLEKSHR